MAVLELRVDGVPVWTGSDSFIGVVFNNLTGRNFDPEHDPAAHAAYVSLMEERSGVRLEAQTQLSITTEGGAVLQSAVLGIPVLRITEGRRDPLILRPVPLLHPLPSSEPNLWLEFQGMHQHLLSFSMADQVQAFLRQCDTEALWDGRQSVTLAGQSLASCFPKRHWDAISKRDFRSPVR